MNNNELNNETANNLGLFAIGVSALIYSAAEPSEPYHLWDCIVGFSLIFMVLSVSNPIGLWAKAAYASIFSISFITSFGLFFGLFVNSRFVPPTKVIDLCGTEEGQNGCASVYLSDFVWFFIWFILALLCFYTLVMKSKKNNAQNSA